MAESQVKTKSTVQTPTTGSIDLESDMFDDRSRNKKRSPADNYPRNDPIKPFNEQPFVDRAFPLISQYAVQ